MKREPITMKKNAECPYRVKRIFNSHPEVQQLRVDARNEKVEIAFHGELPAQEVLDRIHSTVREQFSPAWETCGSDEETCDDCERNVADDSAVHEHKVGGGVVEFHRRHGSGTPRLIWQKIKLPVWQNRPVLTGDEHEHEDDYRVMLLLSGICGLAALLGYGLHPSVPLAAHICFAIAYLSGGWYPAREVFEELRKGRIDVHFLMLVVAVGAAFVDALAEGATLLFLFSLSDALEHWAHYRTQKTIGSLLKSAPKQAVLRRGGAWVEVPIEEVKVGDELLVKAGELFPVDGTMAEGSTSADESALTGESLPVEKTIGDSVSGGTLNLDGQAVVRVLRPPRESAVQKIIALIEHAQQQKAPAQRFTDKFSKYYTWVVLGLSCVMLAVLLANGHALQAALYRTMTLLVVASPCALVLSIPSAILVAIAAGARAGILFRGGVAIENLASVNQFAFDKTGTLTKGHLRVARVEPADAADEILALAAAVGEASTHPLSRAILREAQARSLPLQAAENFKNISGAGMEASVGGHMALVGSRKFIESRDVLLPPAAQESGDAEVCVAAGPVAGTIFLSDEIRPESKDVVKQLLASGANVTLLTGDREITARHIAEQIGIKDVKAALSPDDKLQSVVKWQLEGRRVAMIGDGINDAPSLTAADVAIAMGARGSDAALEQADVVLMHDKIENVVNAVKLSKRARNVIRQNLAISLGVVAVLIVSALCQKITLSLGVVGHEGSTVVVVLNGLRLLRFKGGG